MKVKPNLFIIGAAKSGTTTLYKYLSMHPDIFFSPVKEPNYFSADIDPSKFESIYKKNTPVFDEKYFQTKPLKDVHLAFIRNEEHYFNLFEGVQHQSIVGECSTSYLFSENAAENIKRFNPEAKIIAILRNPISRAYSHYQMGLRFGYTTLSFRKAIEQDIIQPEKGWGISKLYLELGLYYEQLNRYFRLFNPSSIRIYLTDELESTPEILFQDIFKFLQIEDIDFDFNEKHNTASIPKFKQMNKFVVESGLKNVILKLIPESLKTKLVKNLFIKDSEQKISEEDYDFLRKYYRNDILKTASLIGKDLSHWLL